LQPNKLIAWKNKSPLGTLTHTLILFIINLILLTPYLGYKSFIIGLIIIYAIHFIEDLIKIEFTKKYPQYELPAFIWDQVVHFSAITILYWYTIDLQPILNFQIQNFLYISIWTVIFAIIVVCASYVFDIVEFQIRFNKNHKLKYSRNYQGMWQRTLISLVLALGISLVF